MEETDLAKFLSDMLKIENAPAEGDIHIKQPWHHSEFDEWKFNLDAEPEAADDIKELDWESTHRQWDDQYESWVVDLPSLLTTISHLGDAGYEVTIDQDVLSAYEDEIVNG